MTRDNGRHENRGTARINYTRLPPSCATKLAEHPNPRIAEALGHPVRRQVLREIHRREPPCSASDLSAADSLKSESISTVKYHLKVLASAARSSRAANS